MTVFQNFRFECMVLTVNVSKQRRLIDHIIIIVVLWNQDRYQILIRMDFYFILPTDQSKSPKNDNNIESELFSNIFLKSTKCRRACFVQVPRAKLHWAYVDCRLWGHEVNVDTFKRIMRYPKAAGCSYHTFGYLTIRFICLRFRWNCS